MVLLWMYSLIILKILFWVFKLFEVFNYDILIVFYIFKLINKMIIILLSFMLLRKKFGKSYWGDICW